MSVILPQLTQRNRFVCKTKTVMKQKDFGDTEYCRISNPSRWTDMNWEKFLKRLELFNEAAFICLLFYSQRTIVLLCLSATSVSVLQCWLVSSARFKSLRALLWVGGTWYGLLSLCVVTIPSGRSLFEANHFRVISHLQVQLLGLIPVEKLTACRRGIEM